MPFELRSAEQRANSNLCRKGIIVGKSRVIDDVEGDRFDGVTFIRGIGEGVFFIQGSENSWCISWTNCLTWAHGGDETVGVLLFRIAKHSGI